ncbi:MAG: hypothetical protein BWY78_00031 [Alphaproteobacteria bacterium ADurb.Bin438]|nr:MAG: hypothetical protein BWY78_00031 [Alphaproteobacteria bacterium ADurb.Bin438]
MKYDFLDDYFLSKKGVTKDFQQEWNAFRFLIDGKMVAYIGHHKDGREILTLKVEPFKSDILKSEYKDIIEGYYMNKMWWCSIYLDGKVPEEVVKEMIDGSYELIAKGLTKKRQKELGLI